MGGKVFISGGEWQHIATDEILFGHPGMQVSYDFRDTLQFKLDDEHPMDEVVLVINFNNDSINTNCVAPRDKGHQDIHLQNEKWRESKLEKIARK